MFTAPNGHPDERERPLAYSPENADADLAVIEAIVEQWSRAPAA